MRDVRYALNYLIDRKLVVNDHESHVLRLVAPDFENDALPSDTISSIAACISHGTVTKHLPMMQFQESSKCAIIHNF